MYTFSFTIITGIFPPSSPEIHKVYKVYMYQHILNTKKTVKAYFLFVEYAIII